LVTLTLQAAGVIVPVTLMEAVLAAHAEPVTASRAMASAVGATWKVDFNVDFMNASFACVSNRRRRLGLSWVL
jgi:hypothetical protein